METGVVTRAVSVIVCGRFRGGELEPGTFHHCLDPSMLRKMGNAEPQNADANAETADREKPAQEEGNHTQPGNADNG